MRVWLFLFPLLVGLAGIVASACGDDAGGSGLGYAYSLDATPDGVLAAYDDASVNRH